MFPIVQIVPLSKPLGKISNPHKKPTGIANSITPIPVAPCSCQIFPTLTFFTGTKKVPQLKAEAIADANPKEFKVVPL